MITYRGRVVYDRKPDPFTEKAVTRILRGFLEDKPPADVGRFLSEVMDPIYKDWFPNFYIIARFVMAMIRGWYSSWYISREFVEYVLDLM